ncbi:MAG: signal peptidase I [Bradymonadaceae bacterium]|nr:signal peptidase I [Lujinxingiaceae bacterium]
MQAHLNDLRHLVEEEDAATAARLEKARVFVAQHLPTNTKSAWREYFESIGLAVLCALILRGFVIEAFKIPTGSMIPTLLVGDHLFVNKFVYGLRVPFTKKYLLEFSEAKPGEVVVFSFPSAQARAHIAQQPASKRDCIDRGSLENEKDFIKRIVGVEGDTVEVRDNQLIINGKATERTFLRKEATGNFLYPHEVHESETLNGFTYTIQFVGSDVNFGPITVEPGRFFVMGDNRDKSSDSRCWGQVPVENIKGRAMIIWWSIGPDSMRWERIGRFIH